MSILIKNIKGIVQAGENMPLYVAGEAMSKLNIIENGWILTEGSTIKEYGQMGEMPADIKAIDRKSVV